MIKLLTDPFLLLPTQTSVRVVWFTEFLGTKHTVSYGENLHYTAIAKTTKLSRIREDQHSQVKNKTIYTEIKHPVSRDIWRHEAEITSLIPGQRIPYQVNSLCENNEVASSKSFTFTTAPTPNTPLKILLTSDHQLKPMVAANLQKVVETIGQVDAVWFAGDLANTPDRASEWFDDLRGGAFFPCLQGNAQYEMEKNAIKTIYTGGEIIQHAPIFTCIGNHEVMGRLGGKTLDEEFDSTIPHTIAEKLSGDSSNSFNTTTYAEIFHLPTYYAVNFGDVRLVVLYMTNMWRYPNTTTGRKGRYNESEQDLLNPENWGYGQHIYEPIYQGSTQYNWLVQELNSQQFKQAKYKVVMFHHPPHSLGHNIIPPYTDPLQVIEHDNDGIKAVNYEYPKEKNYIIRDVIPLLETAGVQLVFYGHSHLWNRFCSPSGMHFLETSNVGNSYGAIWGENKQDHYGLEPVTPTIAPLMDANGTIPYIASNDLTVFSIFDTATGKVSSYRFDTQQPNSPVVKFDEFGLKVNGE